MLPDQAYDSLKGMLGDGGSSGSQQWGRCPTCGGDLGGDNSSALTCQKCHSEWTLGEEKPVPFDGTVEA